MRPMVKDSVAYAEGAGLDASRLPTHVAIIMDGNGRWAQAQGKHRLMGHNQGYLALKETVYAAQDLGLHCITVFCFSTENWRRSHEEVGGLMQLLVYAMRTEIEELMLRNIRVVVSGRLQELPDDVHKEFLHAAKLTENNDSLIFNLAINYGGRAEVVDSVRALAELVRSGHLEPDEIDEKSIGNHLYCPGLPDPDLLIRTAGEMRLSNFLLWETAYSEIYVTSTCWPDFNEHHLVEALKEYQMRTRKFGAVVP